MSVFVSLACADTVLRVEHTLAHMSEPRAFVSRFTVPSSAAPFLTVTRTTDTSGERVEGPLGSCLYTLRGDSLVVCVDDGPFLGELVLRLAWYIATTRLGGVLIHSAGIRAGDAALVACGKSGDGKSTLSRLCVGAGLTLLTDEVVQLFPDGRVCGTPFRSDADNEGSPGLVRARYFVALEKAEKEALAPLAATAAGRLAFSQAFELDVLGLIPSVERRRRILGFLGSVELRTLAFRKHAEAGRFVGDALGALAG